jgi:hypothetical protein
LVLSHCLALLLNIFPIRYITKFPLKVNIIFKLLNFSNAADVDKLVGPELRNLDWENTSLSFISPAAIKSLV